ncbi:MAG: methyl-accepting chemotaxis protein [Tateyamaria sp.]
MLQSLANPAHTEEALFAHRRAAIDIIATTRARAIRSALFAAYLFRNHPTHPEDEATRANWRMVLREQYDAIARAVALLYGADPENKVPEEVCAWIGEHGASWTKHRASFERMRDLTWDLVDSCNDGDLDRMQAALDAHFTFGRGGFFEMVTEFIDGLWNTLDTVRHEEMEHAEASGRAITRTLTRLEQIGKHVRLVSLNASVEAARVGDAGRGLGVIAVEFKTLAEEIQLLATTARADIQSMTKDIRASSPSDLSPNLP